MSQTTMVRVDSKGRLTIPKAIREAMSVKPGDLFRLRPRGSALHCSKAENPFDLLAEHALEEYREGKTISLDEWAKREGISLEEE